MHGLVPDVAKAIKALSGDRLQSMGLALYTGYHILYKSS